MKIYIGFSSPTGKFMPFASLIKWVESRPYDHAYIRLQDPMDSEYMIFQASKQMVNLFNKDIFQTSNVTHKEYEVEITDEQYAALWRFVKKNLGIPYSLKEDFGILLMKIFKLKNNPYDNGMAAQFCSKCAADACKVLGIDIPENTVSIDPSLLDSILEDKALLCIKDPKF